MIQAPRTPAEVAQRFDVSRESLSRLEAYVALLKKWQERLNLVAPSTLEEIWTRHIADSLQLIPLLPPNTRSIVDLGSGAGLPGVVLALARTIHVHLVEANARKAAFLRQAIRLTGAGATLHNMRIEELALASPPQVVTARALARLPQLLKLAYPFSQGGALCLFHKGQDVERELAEAATTWSMVATRWPSLIDPRGVILAIREIRHAVT